VRLPWMWWQGIDQASLKPTRFPEGDPICAAPGRPAGDRWESQRLLIKAREARPSSGAGARRAAEREAAAARPTRPSSAPALLRGTRLPAGASHEPPPPGRPPKDLALTAFRQGIEDSAVRDQLGVYRQAYRTTKDALNAVDQLADTVLFDLKVLHNKAQRNKSAAAAVAAGRAHEAKKPGLVKVRERRDKSGADKDQCLQARQLKQWAQMMDESTRQTCKSCSVNHRVVQYLAHTDITMNAARLASIEAVAEDSSEDDMTGIKCKTAMLTLSGAFRSSTKEAQRQTEAFHGASECLQQTAEFLTQRGDMRALLEGMDLLRKGHLLVEDWDLGMHRLGFPEDPLHVWVHLSKGHKHVSIDDMEKSLTPNREDCDQGRSPNKRLSVLASDAEGPSPRASRTSKKRNALFVAG